MVTMAQSAMNWHNTHTHVDHTNSLAHLHQHSYNHIVRRSASSAITEFWNQISILKVPEGANNELSTQTNTKPATQTFLSFFCTPNASRTHCNNL